MSLKFPPLRQKRGGRGENMDEKFLEKLFDLLEIDVLHIQKCCSVILHPDTSSILGIPSFLGKVYIDPKELDRAAVSSKKFIAFKPKKHFGVLIVRKDALRKGILRVDKNDLKMIRERGVTIYTKTKKGAKPAKLIEVISPFLPDWREGRIVWRR